MSAWLATLRDRPIADSQRRRALALVTLLLVGCALLSAAARTKPAHLPARKHTAAHQVPRAPAPPPAVDPPHIATPSRAALRVSRKFLAGYLAYLYGHGGARAVNGTTRTLTGLLRAHPPRVTLDIRARHPRIVALHAASGDHGQLTATAMISDGGLADYPVILLITHHGGRLVVSGVGER